MHESCVIDDALKRTHQRLLGVEADAKGTTNGNKKGRRKSNKSKATTNIWDGMFEAKIVPRQAKDATEEEIQRGHVENESTQDTRKELDSDAEDGHTDHKGPKGSAGKLLITDLRDVKQKTWEEDMVCLACQRRVK